MQRGARRAEPVDSGKEPMEQPVVRVEEPGPHAGRDGGGNGPGQEDRGAEESAATLEEHGDGKSDEKLRGDRDGGEVRRGPESRPEAAVREQEAEVGDPDEALLVEDEDRSVQAEPDRGQHGQDGDPGQDRHGGRCEQGGLAARLHRDSR